MSDFSRFYMVFKGERYYPRGGLEDLSLATVHKRTAMGNAKITTGLDDPWVYVYEVWVDTFNGNVRYKKIYEKG